MKYLKLFEDYKPDKYYFEISSDEFLPKFIDNNIGTLTKSELKSINDLGYNFQIKNSSFAGNFYHHDDANTSLQFFMAPEEWFYVSLQNQSPGQKYIAKYYKCDQFDGLLKFLRNYIAYSIFSNKKDRLLKESNYYSEINSDNPHEPSKIPPGSKEGEVLPNDISDSDINFIKKELGIDTKTNIIKREFIATNPITNSPVQIVNYYIFYYNMKGEVGNLNTMSNTHHRDIRLVHVYSYTDEWFKVRIDDRLYWCDQVDAVVKCVQDSIDKDVFYNNINESIHHPNLPEITDEYFDQITPDEFHSLLGISQGYLNPLQILKFTDKEISYLDKLDKEDLTRTGIFNYAFDVMFHHKSITFKMVGGKFTDISGEIFKVNDEWFLVELILDVIDIPIHYKCDQIEGLIHFLKKLKRKK